LKLSQIIARPVHPPEESLFQEFMASYHYLGALPKIGNTIWYAGTYNDERVALLSYSAAALKCGVRENWIGWGFRHQYDRLHLVANNSRFLILPQYHHRDLGSKILSLCKRRIQQDWLNRFGYPLLLMETFVDPSRFVGTIYKAANWKFIGKTKGYQRTRNGYSNTRYTPKLVFVQALQRNARLLLSSDSLTEQYKAGGPRMKLTAEQMRSLPDFFREIQDPRRAQGKRHRIHVVLAISAGAVLCGMRGYKAISDWAKALSPLMRERFGCRYQNGKRIVPSEGTLRDVLLRVEPVALDQALQQWNEKYGAIDQSLAIDGKTMCNAIDETGKQTHIMSAIGHQSGQCYTQKKLELCPSKDVIEKNKPTKSKSQFHYSTPSTSEGKPSLPMPC
jgi:Druantia protein DruA/DDE_Tnp_1-associated